MNRTEVPHKDLNTAPDIFKRSDEIMEVEFAQNLIRDKGEFIYCDELHEFYDGVRYLAHKKQWQHVHCWDKDIYDNCVEQEIRQVRLGKNIEKAGACITKCDALVARTGSIMLSSRLAAGRSLHSQTPALIVLAFNSQMVRDLSDALKWIHRQYPTHPPSNISFINGPSKTLLLDQQATVGGLGNHEVYVFLIDHLK